jgi:hypothetical protein
MVPIESLRVLPMDDQIAAGDSLRVEILELFAEASAWASRKALLASSESGAERVGRNPKLNLFGFTVRRDWDSSAAYQWRREAKEQRETDKRVWDKRGRIKYRAKNLQKERERCRKKAEARRRSLAAGQRWTPEMREAQRLYRRIKKERTEQAEKLEAWKATAKKTRSRVACIGDSAAEHRRVLRAAQAQRRRDRMTTVQKQAEVAKAQQRRARRSK